MIKKENMMTKKDERISNIQKQSNDKKLVCQVKNGTGEGYR